MDQIIDQIYQIEDTSDLDALFDAIRKRRKQLEERDTRKLMNRLVERNGDTPGTRVRIRADARLKPRYILGGEGEVVTVRITKVSVLMDGNTFNDQYGKWAGRIAIVPAHDLEVVED